MNRNFYLLAPVAAIMLALPATAQKLQPTYIEWPSSSQLPNYVQSWKPGTPLFEDENFFVSRVKPKAQIARNAATQVYESINDANDKKLLFWVPVGNTNLDGVHTDALPNSLFDSEVFSSWSYITHYGDWTAPYGWVPAGFADAAHKHGVAVSGVASIPWAHSVSANNSDWGRCITSMGSVDAEKLAQFLLYHGVDGLGYNSEFTATSTQINNLNKTHADVVKYMAGKNPVFENIWYSGTSDNGQLSLGGSSDCLRNSIKNIFGDSDNIRTSIFANYEWNSSSNINTSITNAASLGRKLQDVYAGMNMQGGCKTATEWQTHLTANYSIGLWGAHDFNYLWAPRAQFGSSDDARQKTYQLLQEWWFTNGRRNPAAKMDLVGRTSLGPSADWHGMSRFMSERSTLGWDLDDEPFITYFNLGNGKFFNWMGERQNDKAWYNIGIQDYMPTWRFWFADKFLGKEPADIPEEGLNAEFTWDHAYLGGSCLRISGSTADEYLHLFRTDFTIAGNDLITVRYKLIKGSANVNLALSCKTTETTIVRESSMKIFTTGAEADEDVWVEKTFKVTGQLLTALRKTPLAVVALHITDATDLDLCLGELSIVRGTAMTPGKPTITRSRVLAFNRDGVDAKIIFSMASQKALGEPVYNLDVNTSMFRIWAQQEGCEPVNTGATSSWAAIVYGAPFDHQAASRKMRFGVQAVAVDGKSASDIAWTDYLDCGEYAMSDDITINKKTIKPGENFELSFVDPQHPAADWTILDTDGNQMFAGSGKSVTATLDQLGSYDVVAGETRYPNYISVTAWEKGALPEINTLKINDEIASDVAIETANEFTLGYTGRAADGIGSQGIEIDEGFVGCDFNNVKPDLLKSFAVSAWVNMKYPAATSRIFNIEDRRTTWPVNNWGWCWLAADANGVLDAFSFRREASPDGDGIQYFYNKDKAVIPENAWTHIAMSFEYEGSNFRCRLFINGEELMPTEIKSSTKNVTAPTSPDQFWITSRNYSIDYGCWLSFGGGAGSSAAYNKGTVDDLTIWNTAITADDVHKAMAGLDAANLPDNVMCFWSFEEPAGSDYTFKSAGSKPGCEASMFKLVKKDNEGQAVQTPQIPSYAPGCPKIPGTGYKVETRPTWTVKRAQILTSEGSDTEGSATVKVTKTADYTATLTLENALGSDSRTYPVISAAIAGLDRVGSAAEIEVYTVDDAIMIDFTSAGDYTAEVYDVAGQLVARRTATMTENGMMTVTLRRSGVFLLNISSNGKLIRTVKLVK